MKKRFLEAFLFLILLSSLGCTGSPYVACQDIYPDEWLDLAAALKGAILPGKLFLLLTIEPLTTMEGSF